jgi:hypothetical protein
MRSRRRGSGTAFTGSFRIKGWLSGAGRVGFVLGVSAGVLVVASVFVRRRGANAERRKQLAWLGYVGLMTVLWAAALVVAAFAAPGAFNGSLGTLFWSFLVCTPVAGVRLACAVAVAASTLAAAALFSPVRRRV